MKEKIEAETRNLKRQIYELILAYAESTGLCAEGTITTEWIDWGQMSKREREEYPEAVQEQGFWRIGVDLTGFINT